MIRLALALAAAIAAGVTAWAVAHHRRWRVVLTGRIPGLHEHWRERGRRLPGSVLYVALGDSAALGLGASAPDRGYVGLVAKEIGRITRRPVRVRNLAIDGATCAVVLADELHRVPQEDALVVTLDVGANDVWRLDPQRFREEFDRICTALPAHAIVADLPSFRPVPVGARIAAANRIVREVAAAHTLTVAPVHASTSRGGVVIAIRNVAGDLFHPNDRGYERWAEAFLPAVRARLAASGYDGGRPATWGPERSER